MSEHMFGLGSKKLSSAEVAKIERIAESHGANFVEHHDPGCGCGHGCRDDCPANWRYWFTGPNYGEPHDGRLAQAVYADLDVAGIEI